ncbi:MAG: FHA domain-containing protein [Aquabacterium sp.]
MAVLQNQSTGRRIILRPLHAFGRYAAACQTVMRSADVSQIHARVRWEGVRWELIDQSRNGTTVNGRRVPAGVWIPLEVGAVIRMGADDEAVWTVMCVEPPHTCLFPLDTLAAPIPLRPQGTLLPDEQQAVAEIHCRDGHWLVEYPEGLDHLVDGAAVRINDTTWEFVLCPVLQETVESRDALQIKSPGEVALHFAVSLNEEHTQLRLLHGQQLIDLGERIHHYTLLTLARQRLSDIERSVPALSQGWVSVEQLARMLGVDTGYINIQLFRAKHQVGNALPSDVDFAPLIERRRGEIRFGDNAFSIRRGDVVEGTVERQRMLASTAN